AELDARDREDRREGLREAGARIAIRRERDGGSPVDQRTSRSPRRQVEVPGRAQEEDGDGARARERAHSGVGGLAEVVGGGAAEVARELGSSGALELVGVDLELVAQALRGLEDPPRLGVREDVLLA